MTPRKYKKMLPKGKQAALIYAYVLFTAVTLSGAVVLQHRYVNEQNNAALIAEISETPPHAMPAQAQLQAQKTTKVTAKGAADPQAPTILASVKESATAPPASITPPSGGSVTAAKEPTTKEPTAKNSTANTLAAKNEKLDTSPGAQATSDHAPAETTPIFELALEDELKQELEELDKLALPQTSHHKMPQVAIIIDDIGYQRRPGQRAVNLPGDVTLAFLPYSPFAKKLALQAHRDGKESMLHAPMQPAREMKWGDGLKHGMDKVAMQTSLRKMIREFPHIKGVNNHMGSGLTTSPEAMDWVMEEVVQHKLYFIDSLTTAMSQARLSAQTYNIPTYSRDVFLDHDPTHEAITRQFERFIRLAKQRGFALAIGHPYPETLDVLEKKLASLSELGVELIPVSRLIALPQVIASLPALPKTAKTQLAETKPTPPTNETVTIVPDA